MTNLETGYFAGRFQVGVQYRRAEVQDVLQVPTKMRRGDWLKGMHREGHSYFIFANVGNAGRTGHDYQNQWSTMGLEWQGQNGSRIHQPRFERLLDPTAEVLLFARGNNREEFTFMGRVTPGHWEDGDEDRPVYVEWILADPKYLAVAPEAPPELANIREAIPQSVRADVLERDRICRLCLRPADVLEDAGCWLEVDHIAPVSKGGTDDIDNLQALCNQCNGGKSDRYATDHRRRTR